jgi:hypothetical protein
VYDLVTRMTADRAAPGLDRLADLDPVTRVGFSLVPAE